MIAEAWYTVGVARSGTRHERALRLASLCPLAMDGGIAAASPFVLCQDADPALPGDRRQPRVGASEY